jgi:hypothetical protein
VIIGLVAPALAGTGVLVLENVIVRSFDLYRTSAWNVPLASVSIKLVYFVPALFVILIVWYSKPGNDTKPNAPFSIKLVQLNLSVI